MVMLSTEKPAPNIFERHPGKTIAVVTLVLAAVVDLILGALLIPRLLGIPDAHYHHGLMKSSRGVDPWGPVTPPVYTNSLGFRDRAIRDIPLSSDKYRIVFMGDSTTEGVGLPYEKTFVGIIDDALPRDKYEVLNGGVKSYSPKLYYLKTRYLVENVGLRFNELAVFIDISDIQDDIDYEDFHPTANTFSSASFTTHLKAWLAKHSVLYYFGLRNLLSGLVRRIDDLRGPPPSSPRVNSKEYYDERPLWTVDERVYQSWGRKGLALSDKNMQALRDLCSKHGIRLVIAVYPWPVQILRKDANSRQVTHWQGFAAKNAADFIDLFPEFINGEDPEAVVARDYIPGDMHWNEAGHRRVAERWLNYFSARK